MSGFSDTSSSSSDDSFITDEEKYALEQKRFNKSYKIEEKLSSSRNGTIYTGYKKEDASCQPDNAPWTMDHQSSTTELEVLQRRSEVYDPT